MALRPMVCSYAITLQWSLPSSLARRGHRPHPSCVRGPEIFPYCVPAVLWDGSRPLPLRCLCQFTGTFWLQTSFSGQQEPAVCGDTWWDGSTLRRPVLFP